MEDETIFLTGPLNLWGNSPHIKELFQESFTFQHLKEVLPKFLKESIGCTSKFS